MSHFVLAEGVFWLVFGTRLKLPSRKMRSIRLAEMPSGEAIAARPLDEREVVAAVSGPHGAESLHLLEL